MKIKKKKHIQKSRRKNPSPQIYKELLSLIGTETTARIISDNGMLSITGPLKLSSKGIFEIIVDEMVGGLTKQSYEGRIYFDIGKIIKITGNIIDLQPSPFPEPLSDILQEIKKQQLTEVINKDTTLNINQKFYGSGDYFFPTIRGKLKYNSKDDLYYVRNGKLTIMCAFKISAVRFVNVHQYINKVVIEL